MKSTPTILLVDDDPAVRAGLCRILCTEELRVVVARGVKDALESIFRNVPDLVITDLCMAPLAGWDLVAHLRSHYPKLPIFVITGLPLPSAVHGMEMIEAYFQKPLDLESLVAAVRRQMERLYAR